MASFLRRCKLCYVDTDSLFLALHSPRLEDNVRPGKKQYFLDHVHEFMEDELSPRTQAGKFKIEYWVKESYFRAVCTTWMLLLT